MDCTNINILAMTSLGILWDNRLSLYYFFTPAHGSRAVSKEQKLNLKNKCFDACDLSIQEGER